MVKYLNLRDIYKIIYDGFENRGSMAVNMVFIIDTNLHTNFLSYFYIYLLFLYNKHPYLLTDIGILKTFCFLFKAVINI